VGLTEVDKSEVKMAKKLLCDRILFRDKSARMDLENSTFCEKVCDVKVTALGESHF
jgi:hypothetical protein